MSQRDTKFESDVATNGNAISATIICLFQASHPTPARREQPLRCAGGGTLASTREKNPGAGSSQFEPRVWI